MKDFEMLLQHYGYNDFTMGDKWKMFSFFDLQKNQRITFPEFVQVVSEEDYPSIRRREIPHFALHRRNNFIPLFYGVSEVFLRPRKVPL